MSIRRLQGAICLFLLFSVPASSEVDPLQVWTASGGEARLELRADYLPDFGLEIVHEGVPAREVVAIRRALTGSDHLVIEAPYGNFEGFVGGEIRLDTGWVLRYRGREVRLDGLTLIPGVYRNAHSSLKAYDRFGNHLLNLTHPHILADAERNLLIIHNVDVVSTEQLARMLNFPVLDDMPIGQAWVDLILEVPEGADISGMGPSCDGRPFWPQDGYEVDVALIDIGTVAYQLSEPVTNRVKVAPSATLKNVGEGDVPWIPQFGVRSWYTFEPRDQHPFLVWNMYRMNNDRIQKIAESGVKHAFFTTNDNCTINCGHSGYVLWPGCEDTYSSGNNNSSTHLGPKSEIMASLGLWDNCNSFFDPGCTGGQTEHGSQWTNRMLIEPAELLVNNADYYLDAWYVVQFDVDIWNTMGYHSISPTQVGDGWSFAPLGPFANGRVLDQWVDPDNPGPNEDHAAVVVPSATPDKPYPGNMPQGHINVAVKVTEPESGRYRYNYAVQNYDFDRGVEAFRVPLGADAEVFETWFGGVDGEPGDDWTVTVEDGFVNFEAPENNPLGWFKLFNFEIETDAPPTTTEVVLDLGGDAVVPAMEVAIMGPQIGPQPVLVVVPDSLDFGDVTAGAEAELSVALENTGDAPLAVSALVSPGAPFSVNASDCGEPAFDLAPEASCTLAVTFAPLAGGALTDELAIESNASSSPDVVALTGRGLAPELTLTPDSLNFGQLLVNQQSALEVTVENTGSALLQVSEVASPGAPFTVDTAACGGTAFDLPPAQDCVLTVTFAPDEVGEFADAIELHSNAASTPDQIDLSGEAIAEGPIVMLSPDSLDFGGVVVSGSHTLEVVMSNAGDQVLSVSGISLSGAAFDVDTGDCGGMAFDLAPAAECTLVVTFTPPEDGEYAGAISVISNAGSSPDAVTLSGIGLGPEVFEDRFELLLGMLRGI